MKSQKEEIPVSAIQVESRREHTERSYLLKVVDALPQPIMVIGTDYKVKLVNKAMKRSEGYPGTNPVGAYCYKLLHKRDTPCDGGDHPCPLQKVFNTHETVSMIHRHYKRDGTAQIVQLEASPIIDDTGKFIGIIESTRDITSHIEKENRNRKKVARLSQLAHHDPLTSLPNRLLFKDRLNHALAKAARNGNILSVLFIDLDGFKRINDNLGHDAGDQLLCSVATKLKSCLRESDTLARLGGDEYIILLDELSKIDGAIQVARNILEIFSNPFQINNKEVYVTGSIGISVYPQDAQSAEKLMKHADMAMYEAKRAHKNNYKLFYQQIAGHKETAVLKTFPSRKFGH